MAEWERRKAGLNPDLISYSCDACLSRSSRCAYPPFPGCLEAWHPDTAVPCHGTRSCIAIHAFARHTHPAMAHFKPELGASLLYFFNSAEEHYASHYGRRVAFLLFRSSFLLLSFSLLLSSISANVFRVFLNTLPKPVGIVACVSARRSPSGLCSRKAAFAHTNSLTRKPVSVAARLQALLHSSSPTVLRVRL